MSIDQAGTRNLNQMQASLMKVMSDLPQKSEKNSEVKKPRHEKPEEKSEEKPSSPADPGRGQAHFMKPERPYEDSNKKSGAV